MRLYLFYTLSFLEGASVMAAELLGAKMLAPYFGTSLYVWSSVLAVTLGGLAMGYFSGGIVSEKKNTERNLYYILLLSALFLIIMPLMAKEVMPHTAGFSLLASIVISVFMFLFPPVFFMGMVSPMIVQCITSAISNPDRHSGKVAGMVYAISTLGGIFSTFLLGFYFIPEFGLTMPAITVGIILGIIPLAKLISSKSFFSLIFLPIAVGIVFLSFSGFKVCVENSDIKILYSSEGLLGQIIVADYPIYEDGKKAEGSQRILFVNRSTQTIVKSQNGKKSYFDYVNLIEAKIYAMGNGKWIMNNENISSIPEGTHSINHQPSATHPRALVLGLGGGIVADELVKNGFQVDAVELDKRIPVVATKYFDLDKKVNVHIDDARHFINSQLPIANQQFKYDVIVLDAFIGESNPNHLFTKEFFGEVKSLLSDSGEFFINGNGFWKGEAGRGMRSVCKTLINSGFDVELEPTAAQEEYSNMVFIAQKEAEKIGKVKSDKITSLNLENAIVLIDEKPQLEILNAEANLRWREGCISYFLSGYYSGMDKLLFK